MRHGPLPAKPPRSRCMGPSEETGPKFPRPAFWGTNVGVGKDRKLLPAGTVVGGSYRIVERVAEGGFAVVYRAQVAEEVVALKVLDPPRHTDAADAFLRRFQREAEVASKVRHGNVVEIRAYAADDEGPWIAMDLLTGHDLKRELARYGPMKPARVLPLFIGALEGLQVGHAQGIVHRDLKPGNLFLHTDDAGEKLVLLDFGIARPTGDADENLTATGHLLGTPRYYAPEYATRQLVTPALDVYQMGLILLEVLTGAPAVPHSDPYTCLLAHCQGRLEFPETLQRSPLGEVLMRALNVDHRRRFADAGTFAAALRSVDPDGVLTADLVLAPSVASASAVTVETRGAPESGPAEWTPRLAEPDTVEATPSAIADALWEAPPSVHSIETAQREGPAISPCPLCLTPTALTGTPVVTCPRCKFRFDAPAGGTRQPAWVAELPLPVGFEASSIALPGAPFVQPDLDDPAWALEKMESGKAAPLPPSPAVPQPDLDLATEEVERMRRPAARPAPLVARAEPPAEDPVAPIQGLARGSDLRGQARRRWFWRAAFALVVAVAILAGWRFAVGGWGGLQADAAAAARWITTTADTLSR